MKRAGGARKNEQFAQVADPASNGFLPLLVWVKSASPLPLPPPLTVDQKSAERLIGIPKRKYLAAWKRRFHGWKDGRQCLAMFRDVARYWAPSLPAPSSTDVTGEVSPASEPIASPNAYEDRPEPNGSAQVTIDQFLSELGLIRTE